MLVWADKLVVVWAAVVYAVFILLLPIPGQHGAMAAWLFSTWAGAQVPLRLVLPVWLLLRLVDWATGGPARRRGQVRARVMGVR